MAVPPAIDPVVQEALDASACAHARSQPDNIQCVYEDIKQMHAAGYLVKFEGNQVVCYDPERSTGPTLTCSECVQVLQRLINHVFVLN